MIPLENYAYSTMIDIWSDMPFCNFAKVFSQNWSTRLYFVIKIDPGVWPNESETQEPLPAGTVKDNMYTILKIDQN